MTTPDLSKVTQLIANESAMSWLTTLVNFVLILLAAFAAAQLTWRFIPDSEASIVVPQDAATNRGNTPVTQTGVDINRLVSQHLFGKANAKRTPVVKKAAPIVETRLPLTLRGVIASDRPDTARAIISAPNAGELPYAVGATLPGNAKLEEIHPDKIILSRGGQLENLLLPKEQDGVSLQSAPMPQRRGNSNEDVVTGIIETPDDFRDALLDDPESLTGLVNTVPETNAQGRLIGFKLQPGRDAGFLQRFGLQSGDVLTSVNGIKLDSPVRALEVIRELGEAGQVNIEVLRNNIPQTYAFSFDQG